MKKIFFFLFSIFIVFSSNATHLMGGQITASYLSSDSTGSHYIFELTAYRDTIGIPMGISAVFDIESYDTSNGTWNSLQTYTVTYDTSSGNLLPTVTVYGVEVYSFLDTITLPGNGYYSISWSECCRNAAIVNMYSPLSENLHLTTYLTVDNLNPNSSPTFLTPPVAYLPITQLWNYNPLPFDPDGDSLTWSLVDPISNGVSVAGYESLSDTLLYSDPAGIFSLDSVTGEISWQATMVGNFVISLIIEEFRNGIKIGEMRRDMQFITVVPDSSSIPHFSYIQNIPTNSAGYPYVKLLYGQSYQLDLIGSDIDPGDVLTMEAYGESFALNNSSSLFNSFPYGSSNDIMGVFNWSPNFSNIRPEPYINVFRVSDGMFNFDKTILFEVVASLLTINEFEGVTVNDIYPNPSNGNFILSLSLDKPEDIYVEIYNLLGLEISKKKLNLSSGNHILSADNNLSSGQYVINILNEKGVSITTQKLIVIN
jgi:hypothetical protein